jgi:Na(+)-translocating NADH:ubiquinone oxidoreductase A subunit
VALIGFDYVGLKPKMLIEEGQQVRLGQAMFQDKTNPDVVFTAPGAGLVKAITRGHRRVLQSVVIELSGDDQETWEVLGGGGEKALDAAKVREVLRASGLWTALRARPFSKIPPIDGQPYAVFVTAIDTSPLAADPGLVMRGREKEFTAGLSALGTLTPGKVHVCTGPGLNPAIPESGQFNHAQFSGPHPAGLVGTHIHMLSPVGAKRTVWHIGYQDVIEIGHLLLTGRRDPSRVIALAGPKVKRPRLIRTRLGASTRELLKDELSAGASRVISGSVLSGRRASDWSAYLGRYHTQISVIGDDVERKFLAFSRPGPEKFSVTRTGLVAANCSISRPPRKAAPGPWFRLAHTRRLCPWISCPPSYCVRFLSRIQIAPSPSDAWNWTRKTWRFVPTCVPASTTSVRCCGVTLKSLRGKADACSA